MFGVMLTIIILVLALLSIILLYNKEAVSCMPCSLSAIASLVAATGSDTVLYSFQTVFLKKFLIFIIYISGNTLKKYYGQKYE